MQDSSNLARAESYFRNGRVEECAELLESVMMCGSAQFSRAQWRTAANLLACKTKISLRLNDHDQLLSVRKTYKSLWERIVGLPITVGSLLTEMTVTFALCQLEHILMSRGRLVDPSAAAYMGNHCERLCSFLEVKWNNLADSLPQIVHKIAEHKDLLLKMVYLVAVLELRSLDTVTKGLALMSTLLAIIQNQTGGEQSNVETGIMLALKVKEGLNADCGDLLYLQAWQLYNKGDCAGVVSLLSNAPSTPAISLLRGHCYVNLKKPQSAQCCYLSCLTSPNQVASLAAMASCCHLYNQLSDHEAELEARILRLEALQSSSGCVREGMLWWRGECLCDDPVTLSEEQWTESAYIAALRALSYEKLEVAINLFRDLLKCGHQSTALPPPSMLHLLLARTLLLSGDSPQAWIVCERLTDHLSILELEECTPQAILRLAQSLLLGALSLVGMEDFDRAKCFSHKSYQVCSFLISRLNRERDPLYEELESTILLLMELSLVVLACISVGAGEKSKALSLLTQAVAISPQSPKPLTLYNYCLLLTQIGKLNEAANGWLEMHSQLPTNKTEARHRIVNLKKSSNPGDYERMDMAMLKLWIRQSR